MVMAKFAVWRVVGKKTRTIDIVYFDTRMTCEEVRKSLINHDGYPSDIKVVRQSV